MNTAHTNTNVFWFICAVNGYNLVLLGGRYGLLCLIRKRISTDARQAYLQRKSRLIYSSIRLFDVRPRYRSLE